MNSSQWDEIAWRKAEAVQINILILGTHFFFKNASTMTYKRFFWLNNFCFLLIEINKKPNKMKLLAHNRQKSHDKLRIQWLLVDWFRVIYTHFRNICPNCLQHFIKSLQVCEVTRSLCSLLNACMFILLIQSLYFLPLNTISSSSHQGWSLL